MTSPTTFAHLRYARFEREAHLPHRVEHAAMRRLEPVAHVRQRSPDDHAHRVIQVRALHLVFDVDGNSLFSRHSGLSAWPGLMTEPRT